MKIKFLTRQVLQKLATFVKLKFLIVPILLLNSFTLPIQINTEANIVKTVCEERENHSYLNKLIGVGPE